MKLIEGSAAFGSVEGPPAEGKRKCLLFHRFALIQSTGVHRYESCARCGMRRIRRVAGGYQPVDLRWLDTGKLESFRSAPLPEGGTAARTSGR